MPKILRPGAFLLLLLVAVVAVGAQELHGQSPPPTAFGPAARRLTLEEARHIALSSNKSLMLARLNIIEKQLAMKAARTDYFPKVLGNVTYFHFDQPLGGVEVAASGARGVLPTSTPLISTAVLNQDASLATIFVAQPITKLIAVNAAVQAARADQCIAQAQAEKGERDIVSGVTQLYHGILGARRIHAALGLQARLLEEIVAAKPVPELRVALIEVKQGLTQVRAQEQELVVQLNGLLDLPQCTVLDLTDPMPPQLPVHCADEAAQLACQNNPEIREAAQTIAKAQAGRKVARMDFLPDVNVIGGYANQTGANYIQDNIGYLGLSANYTFWGWGKRKHILDQRNTDISMANQALAVTIDKVQTAARKAFIEFQQAQEAFQLSAEMVEARQAVEKAAMGAAAFQARGETAKAQLEQMKTELAYRIAHAKLAAAIGMP